MNITILHYRPEEKEKAYGLTHSVKLIKAAAKEQGHKVKVVRAYDCQLDFTGKKMAMLYKNKPFPKTDVIIVRPGFNKDYDVMGSTIKHFQSCGYTLVNKYLPVIYTKNKIRTLQFMKKHHLNIPKTMVIQDREYLTEAAEKIGKFPMIVKAASGCQGKGVMYVPDNQTLNSVMDLLMQDTCKDYLIQEYIEESKGCDVRIFTVGGKVVASMERIAPEGEFRSNFHLGGEVRSTEISHEEKTLALKAAKVLGMEVAGVDILRSNKGPMLLEVNANPGLEGITKATGVDIAGAIVKYAVKKAKTEKTKKDNKTTRIEEKIKANAGLE